MTKADKRRKQFIINAVTSTAAYNGKPSDPETILSIVNRLHRLETTLSRLAKDECNFPVYDAAKQERIEKLAEKIIRNQIGCKCYTQRDPRGMMIRMYCVDTDGNPVYNSWDGETTGFSY